MALSRWAAAIAGVAATAAITIAAQQAPTTPTPAGAQAPAAPAADDPVRTMVGRLTLERYKGTIKGLTQFGDRRQGTQAQSRRARLDRSAAQELWLHEHRAHHLHVSVSGRQRSQRAATRRRWWRRRTRRRRRRPGRRGGRRRTSCGRWTGRAAGRRRTGRGGRRGRRGRAGRGRPGPARRWRWWRPRRQRRSAGRTGPQQLGRVDAVWQPPRDRRLPADQRERGAARSAAARAQQRARASERSAQPAAERVLHQDRHDAPRRDVHHRRAHGRPRLGRSGERRRLRHRAGDGTGAHLQLTRRRKPSARSASRSGTTKKTVSTAPGLRQSAPGAAGDGRSARVTAAIPSRSGSA